MAKLREDSMWGNKYLKNRNSDYAIATGSANNYAINLSPPIISYVEGLTVLVKINIENSGSSTININTLGAKNIVKGVNTALSSGDLLAGQIIMLCYNGTSFQIVR